MPPRRRWSQCCGRPAGSHTARWSTCKARRASLAAAAGPEYSDYLPGRPRCHDRRRRARPQGSRPSWRVRRQFRSAGPAARGRMRPPWRSMAACGFDICAAPAQNTSPCFLSIAGATAEGEGALRQFSARCVTKRQQLAIPCQPTHAKHLHATDMRALRFALANTWVVSRLGHLPRNEDGHLLQEREIFLRRSRRASARHCSHGSSTWLR